jgi:signal transduction histidine kinase
MPFRGTLIRLAAWYFLLLALVLVCFNVIVFFSVSEALHARVSQDLQAKSRYAINALTPGSNGTLAAYGTELDPSYADTFIYVIQTNHNGDPTTVVENYPAFLNLPSQLPIQAAKEGATTQSELTVSQQKYALLTEPIYDKSHKNVIGVIQAAKPISSIDETLNRLEQQLAIASGIALLLGLLVAVLMANKSLHPLRLAFRRQREFVADASHELRTPLTLIRTNAEAWIRRAPGSPQATFARHIVEEVEQLTRIVSDLSLLALADARALPVADKPVDLTGLVRELVDHTRPLAQERGITLRAEMPEDHIRMTGDASRIRQLLIILLDNALAYTQAGGAVSLRVASAGNQARISVEDNGAGIDAEDLPHIFERFYRADKARSRERGGTGLGLAIARWIVDAHGGSIDINSEVGTGTLVTLTFPALPPVAEGRVALPAAAEA